MIKGIWRCTSGLLQTLLAFMQWFGGGKKEAEGTFSKACKNLTSGAIDLGSGVVQLGAGVTFISPVLRGAQAVIEPFELNGIYAPAGKNRTQIQDLFGLNSWKNGLPVEHRDVGPELSSFLEKTKPKTVLADSVSIRAPKPKPKTSNKLSLEGLVMSYKMLRMSSGPRCWVFRKGKIKGPYPLDKVISAYKEGNIVNSDRFSCSPSGPWRGWESFQTAFVKRRSSPKEILATIALRYPRYYQTQINRSLKKSIKPQKSFAYSRSTL